MKNNNDNVEIRETGRGRELVKNFKALSNRFMSLYVKYNKH